MTPLARSFYERDAREVAVDLLNKVLVRGERRARLVEVEAYLGADDPGSHAYRGRTKRNATMFGPAGRLYVYFTYGMHWCANAVCGDEGVGSAVLLRAAEPLCGLVEMYRDRGPTARRDRDLCSGPAKLAQAFGLDGSFDGVDLTDANGAVWIGDDGTPPPGEPAITTRIGLTRGVEHPWRFHVPAHDHVSRR